MRIAAYSFYHSRRRLLAVLLSLMLLTLCSCGKKESASVSKDPASASTPVSDWEKFVNDSEKWADSYIELAEKVSKNLSDASLLSEYTDMAAEALDWAKEVASLEDTLSAQDAAAFAKEIARITAKLAKAGL